MTTATGVPQTSIATAFEPEAPGKASGGVAEDFDTEVNIGNEVDLVQLRATRKQCSNERSADAAADVAHEIDQAGNAAALFRGQAYEGSQINGNAHCVLGGSVAAC